MGQELDHDLELAAAGDVLAQQRVWAEHYEALHACAADYLSRQWGNGADGARISLGVTDVLHEACLRLMPRIAAMEHGRRYFFRAFLQECMRIVVEHYRRTRHHRGRGALKRVPFESDLLPARDDGLNLDSVLDAIVQLQGRDERAGQIAYLRVLEGKTIAECAELLGFGTRTIEADWSFAKAWLDRHLRP